MLPRAAATSTLPRDNVTPTIRTDAYNSLTPRREGRRKEVGRGSKAGAPYWEITVTWAEADPKITFRVTGSPADQNVPVPPMGPLTTNDVSAPGASADAPVAVKVSGPLAVFRAQLRVPPDTRHDPAHAGELTVVPAITTWQADELQVMGLPPLFFTVTDTAVGDVGPALKDAPTMEMLVLEVALSTRL
jgi:hypothetical protein